MTSTPIQAWQRTATIRDVAKLAGVDRSVVSRVISGDPHLRVREATRLRVEHAIAELDYRPNPVARGLRTRQSNTVTLLVPDIANPVIARIVAGAQRKAVEFERALMLGPAIEGGGTIRDFGDLLRRGRTDGLLIAVARLEDEAVRGLESAGLPVVLVNRRSHSSLPHVVVDDVAAARAATEYLLDRNHASIVHVAGDIEDAETAGRRRDGFLAAMRAAGVRTPARFVIDAGYSEEAGYAAAHRLLAIASKRPTAIFCASTRSAIGALAAARELGIDVPDDLSIIGFHDFSLAAFVSPGLTVVDLPLEEMGYEAMNVLNSLISGDSVASMTLPHEPVIVERQSVGPPRTAS